VYRAGGLAGYPALLLAEGRVPRLSVPSAYAWIDVPLTTIDPTPIAAGGHYWVVLRNETTGGNTYAGHIEYERLKDCSSDDLPDNHMYYRQTDDAGGSWDSQLHRREMFFRLYGSHAPGELVETTRTLSERLGVDFRLALHRDQEREYRAGYVAMHNL
jgi:hypothetical protein